MAGGGSVAVSRARVTAPGQHDAVLQEMGFAPRASGIQGVCRYDRVGRHTSQAVLSWYDPFVDSWWFAPRTIQWDPGIKFNTPEAAVAFAEVERWGRADVQGTV